MNTTHFLNRVMGNLFGTQTTPSLPTQYWFGLSASAPTIDGTDTGEPSTSGTGYSRVLLSDLSVPIDGVVTNNSAISLPESSTAWGNMLYYTVRDAQNGGNLLFFDALSISRNVEPGTVITVKSGELKIRLRNPSPTT